METIKEISDPYVLYLVVKKSLNMSPGKIAAQCSHATGMIYDWYFEVNQNVNLPIKIDIKLNIFDEWKGENYRKVVLSADDKEFEKLKLEPFSFLVTDQGLTEIPEGSETVIGFYPMKKSERSNVLKRLQLLK